MSLNNILKWLFGIDPSLADASERTDKLAAYVDGDTSWMLSCRPKNIDAIECDDGNTYKRDK